MDANVQGENVRGGGHGPRGKCPGGYPGANVQGGSPGVTCPGGTCPGGKRLEGEMSGGGGGGCPRITPTSAIIIDTEHDTEHVWIFFLLTNVNIHF